MTEDDFWEHIRATRRKGCEEHCERLQRRLAKLPAEEIIDFNYWWSAASRRAYLRDLWGAAYLINGGCSDDGFEYFRWWLILQGRKVYDSTLRDPDSLAAVVDPDEEVFECECRADIYAYFEATGLAPDDKGDAAFDAARKLRHPKWPELPKLAPRWAFDDDKEMRKRFPKLAAMYLGDGDE